MHSAICIALVWFLTLQIALPDDQSHLASVSARSLEAWDSLTPTPPPAPGVPQTDVQAISGLLLKMVDCWNAHDIDGYMEPIWNSPDLWCVGGADIFFGYAQLYAGCRRGYVNRDDMGV
jgi:hypothetical protein